MPPQPSLARIPSSQSSIVQKETKKSRVLYLLSDQLTISEANEVRKLVEKEDTVKEFSTAKDL